MQRRRHLKLLSIAAITVPTFAVAGLPRVVKAERPNLLIAISDDQSWPHASAYGSTMVDTPAFDRVAREGALFTQAFCASPGCSPSRAALLTGRHTWQLEHAGTHASFFDPKYKTFPDRLVRRGYWVGHTGKGWGPGDYARFGRPHNPAGPEFAAPDTDGPSPDYVAAFRTFLEQRDDGKPFCFWFGSRDAHRPYQAESGLANGKKLSEAEVPSFLPDTPEIRSDLLDYAIEIERFDADLAAMLRMLEEAGLLDETLVIVTSDNGMPFPRAKANCYEHGIHVPLAIRWPGRVAAGQQIDALVGFVDLTATIYEAMPIDPSNEFPLAGESFLTLMNSADGEPQPTRDEVVYAARERHSSSRYNSLGYPQRALRTPDYLYIQNGRPERWPAGPAEKYSSVVYDQQGRVVEAEEADPSQGYHDIDACPTLTHLVENQDDPNIRLYLELAVAHRPREELFDINADPGCLHNLAGQTEYAGVLSDLRERLTTHLKKTGDPRVTSDGDIWETYPRVSKLRWFPRPEWAIDSPEAVPQTPWLEERRPRR